MDCVFFKILACLFEGLVGAICLRIIEMLLWNLWHLEQTCPYNLPKSRHNRTRGAPGDAKIGSRGYPQEVPKNRSEKLVPAVLFVIFSNTFPQLFLDGFVFVFQIVLALILTSFV